MYLDTGDKTQCFGCEGCVQVCPKDAVQWQKITKDLDIL